MRGTKRVRVIVLCMCLGAGSFGLASFAYGQVVNTISTVDFGSYDFASSYSGNIQLGTDGAVQIVGSGIVSNGGEAAGHIQITSPSTGVVDIKCSQQAQLTDPSATSLTIQNIEIAVNTGTTFGGGYACNGIGAGNSVATTIDLSALPNPNIYIGGEIVIASPITLPSDHVYNTTGTGTPIMLSIVLQ